MGAIISQNYHFGFSCQLLPYVGLNIVPTYLQGHCISSIIIQTLNVSLLVNLSKLSNIGI